MTVATAQSSARTYDVVGVGAACLDIVSRVPEAPEIAGPRSKVRVSDRASRCGGQTATAVSACARLGLRTAFVGQVGSDAAGDLVRRTLAGRGVNVTHLLACAGATATAIIVIPESSGERMVLWHRDAELTFDPKALPVPMLQSAQVVHVDDVDLPLAVAAARIARRAGVLVTTDIDQTEPAVLDLVAQASHAIFAGHVPEVLTGESSPERALEALGRRYPDAVLCVTRGAEGALLWQNGALLRVAGHVVPVVDTTGAGDIFRAGFIYGLCRAWSIEKVLRFANAAAAWSCTRPGGIEAAPTVEDLATGFGL